MNAIELAECFELYAIDHNPDGFPAIRQGTLNSAADMLRKQHEAIKQLREALDFLLTTSHSHADIKAEKALKDTEGL